MRGSRAGCVEAPHPQPPGVIALVVGSGLVGWDWLMAALGRAATLFLGATHLLVDLTWAMTLPGVQISDARDRPTGT
jgi:hypothetical protein